MINVTLMFNQMKIKSQQKKANYVIVFKIRYGFNIMIYRTTIIILKIMKILFTFRDVKRAHRRRMFQPIFIAFF